MEKNRKNLKSFSILVLFFVAFSLIRMIVDVCVNGFGDVGQLPEGTSAEVAEVVLVIVWALGIVFLLPQVYIGIKGIKQAQNPTHGKAHMIWAVILTAMSAISLISGIVDISKAYSFDKLLTVADVLVNVIVFGAYYFYARKVAKEL
jgi:hypothetical protein